MNSLMVKFKWEPMNMRTVPALLFLVVLTGCGGPDSSEAPSTAKILPLDLDRFSEIVAAHRGHPVVVKCWASWCAPCVEELPVYQQALEVLGPRGLRAITVCMDTTDLILMTSEPLLNRFPMDAEHYYIPPEYSNEEMIEGLDPEWSGTLPFLILFDADGKRAATHMGQITFDELRERIEPLLAGKNEE